MLDVIMIGIDVSLIVYFYNFAISSPDMSARMIACAAMTMEVYFIRRHFKAMRRNVKVNKK